jgi:ubiquinone/menaquinone biosynthesis C-methylase UbiE
MPVKRKRHDDSGMSSRGFQEAEEVLAELDLREGDVLLDAGCADGYFSLPAARMVGAEGRIYAVDSHRRSIDKLRAEAARRHITNLKAVAADLAESLPLEDESVDRCLMCNVFHALVANQEVEKVMGEIYRVLKPGGILCVVDFRVDAWWGPSAEIRVSPEEVAELVAEHGFQKVRGGSLGRDHYVVVLRKT